MGVPERLSIRRNEAHHSVASDEKPAAVWALEAVHWVRLASGCVPLPCAWVREMPATIAYVHRIPLASQLVRISCCPAVLATEPQDCERRNEGRAAMATVEAVRGIHLAVGSVTVPRVGVLEHLTAKANVRGVVLARHDVRVPESSAVRGKDAYHPEGRQELPGAVWAFEAVRGVHLARRRVLVPRCTVRENRPAEALVPRVFLTT
mmetsp:Transcript_103224/g.291481  ORF Transcript_103224/g.291481 Transcript_103224/m.291481 type:complete len:206 (-) Transcript_103224:142-759(-)